MNARLLQVGEERRGASPVTLTDAERSTHLHVLGASGAGKSRFLEYLIRQDVAQGRGLCLIDPHGHLFDRVRDWIALRGLGRVRTIRLFEPTREGWTFGFNPLPSRGLDHARVEYAVDAVVNTLASVWGGEDTTKTPRLRRCLKLTLYALAANDLTLAEAGIFTATADPDGLRKRLTETLGDPFIAGSQTTGGSQAHGRNWSQGHSEGESETLRPIIERAYNQTYSLDEQVFEQTKELQTQQTGEALLRRPTGELVRLRIPHVDDRSTALTRVKRQIETFNERSLEAGTFSVPQVVVEREIAERQARLTETPSSGQTEPDGW